MKSSDRKAAIAQYKSRTITHGICAVRCAAAGETWIAATTQAGTGRNSLWTQLRGGSNHNPTMKAAWQAHGEASFTYELVETFEEGLSPHELEAKVIDRLAYWKAALKAAPIW
jgi:hypothetical protein